MKISIVTISFNQKRFLKDCMDSVLAQRDELNSIGVELEYIIVDPGSNDGSRELIESYSDNTINLFQPDSGPANGLNIGFSRATGDIGFFLNSDDMLLPGSLKTVAALFSNHKEVGLIIGNGYFIDSDGNKTKEVKATSFTKNNYLYGAVSFIQQSVFFRMQAFREVGGFNEINTTCWDGELFLDIVAKGYSTKLVNQHLGLFRLHDESITGSGRLTKKYELERERIFEKVTGRKQNLMDKVYSKILKLRRMILHPSILLRGS